MPTDPVSAFSLAAGVLQVLDVSFRALSTCYEIHKYGSLAQHDDTREITQNILETTRHLESTYTNMPASAVKHNNHVIDLSKRCTETAAELLTELNKLQRDPKGGLRQSLGKAIQSLRKKRFLAAAEGKLTLYREVLNTRILSKLDYHALQQIESYSKLDQKVQDLAVALSEGRNTYEQLLATHTTVIKEHIDRRLDDMAHEEAKLRRWQQFKDSLSFPEIYARQDDIVMSHEGTCRWIFGPNQAEDETDSMRESSDASSESRDVEEIRAQPWSSFKDWLEGNGNGPYWLSGKPGSGKSTLMKYISTEFSSYCHSHETLSAWGDAVTCSFFFWNLGSPLQKNYIGLLRSLLFQIAEQRSEMIPIMSDQCKSAGTSQMEIYGSTSIYTWTEKRLEDALARFLQNKPPSMRVCIFIDGLDEFVGDEDLLINTIHVLSHASGTKVCASSRPEQIFRQGFDASPQLKLQDLNYPDIHKATVERLTPVLEAYVSCAQDKVDYLVHQVVEKSQGIFLWADLMTKDLKTGAREAGSIEELKERLERTPETIDGLYKHMLSRLNKAYLRDAARYFHHLLMYQWVVPYPFPPPTLLGFACIEEGVSSQHLHQDPRLLQFSPVQEMCRRVEIRILTRCAGLVEIDEHAMPHLEYLRTTDLYEMVRFAQEGIASFVRQVKFIHKSAADFVRNHEEFFEDSNWQSTGTSSVVREQIAIARLAPSIISEPRSSTQDRIVVSSRFVEGLVRASCPEFGCCQAIRDTAARVVDEIYDVLCYLNTSFNGPTCTMMRIANLDFCHQPDSMNSIDNVHPFQRRLGFATYSCRHDYVAQYMASNKFSQSDVEYILNCAILGFGHPCFDRLWASDVRSLLHILLEYTPLSTDPYVMSSHNSEIVYVARKSKWAAFLTNSFYHLEKMILYSDLPNALELINLWKQVITTFLDHDANADTKPILTSSSTISQGKFIFEETFVAYMERIAATAQDAAVNTALKEIEDLVRAYGGTSRRKVKAINFWPQGVVRVTEDQSNHLLNLFSLEDLATLGVIESIPEAATPTESDLKDVAQLVDSFQTGWLAKERRKFYGGRT
ncbi:MAG: hypothetical protein LQ349_007192 [Xanthoria aureola]|nr:MAG: hypothetical protein LQ349_007192 [Xanthoria aureola]